MNMNPDENPPDRLAGADDMFDGPDDVLADAVRQWRAQLVGGMMLFTEHRAIAFADVKRQIQGARSLTYKMRMEQGDKALDFKIYLRLPGQMRQEAPGELITVFDFQKQRSVSLIPKQKQA